MLEEFEPIEPLPRRIESERLLLRQVQLRDAREIAELHHASYVDHLRPWSPLAIPHENLEEAIADHESFCMLALERWEDDLDYRFAIVLKHTPSDSPSRGEVESKDIKSQGEAERKEQIIGLIGVTNIIRGVTRAGFIGYWIGKDHLRKGYATEATVLMLEYAFEMLRLHRINLWIAPDNAASLRIVEKLGLRYEGTVIKALFLGGEWKDTRSFAILQDEWQLRKAEFLHFLAPHLAQ